MEGEAGSWVFIGLCLVIGLIFYAAVHNWEHQHPIKVEPKDPEAWPYYIDRNTGAMWCNPSEIIMSKKFQRESKELSKLIKEHNGELPFLD